MKAFFQLHSDLPREGPGEAADVAWAVERAGATTAARVLDAGCGPGADLAALLAAMPDARITGIDGQSHFIEAARRAHPDAARLDLQVGDMTAAKGPFDFIWCAGALYFLGLETGLRTFREKLGQGGAIAFSEPCYFTQDPSPGAKAFWAGEDVEIRDEDRVVAAVENTGFEVLGTRRLSDAAWEAYYTPMDARIAKLRPGASPELSAVLDDGLAEAAGWRAHRAETGCLLVVAR